MFDDKTNDGHAGDNHRIEQRLYKLQQLRSVYIVNEYFSANTCLNAGHKPGCVLVLHFLWGLLLHPIKHHRVIKLKLKLIHSWRDIISIYFGFVFLAFLLVV